MCFFSKLPSWKLRALHVWCLGLIHHWNISCTTQASRFCGGPSIKQYWKNRIAKNIVPFSSYVSLGSFPKKRGPLSGSTSHLALYLGPCLSSVMRSGCRFNHLGDLSAFSGSQDAVQRADGWKKNFKYGSADAHHLVLESEGTPSYSNPKKDRQIKSQLKSGTSFFDYKMI